jgi:hypothetical protein
MQHFVQSTLSTFNTNKVYQTELWKYLLSMIVLFLMSAQGCSVPHNRLTAYYSLEKNLSVSANDLPYRIVSYQLSDTTTLFNSTGIIPVFKLQVLNTENDKIDNYVFNYQVYSSRIAGAMTQDIKKHRQPILRSTQNSDTSEHQVNLTWDVPQGNSSHSQGTTPPIRTTYWSIDSIGIDRLHELEVYNVLSIPNSYLNTKQSYLEYPAKETYQKAYSDLLAILKKRLR